MAMGTLYTAKKPVIYGDGDTLHCKKDPHVWRWGHFALPKSPSYTVMGTLCTAKKRLIYGDGDTLHCKKAPHIWRWGHFALPKSPSYMAMGTLCTPKKTLTYGDGDTSSFVCPVRCAYWGLTSMYTSRRTDRRPPFKLAPLTPRRAAARARRGRWRMLSGGWGRPALLSARSPLPGWWCLRPPGAARGRLCSAGGGGGLVATRVPRRGGWSAAGAMAVPPGTLPPCAPVPLSVLVPACPLGPGGAS